MRGSPAGDRCEEKKYIDSDMLKILERVEGVSDNLNPLEGCPSRCEVVNNKGYMKGSMVFTAC